MLAKILLALQCRLPMCTVVDLDVMACYSDKIVDLKRS